MHRHTLALFFFLTLLSVIFAKTYVRPGLIDDDTPGYGGSRNGGPIDDGYIFGGGGGGDESLRGKRCSSVLECGTGWLYCIDKICQEKQPGRDCVAEGSFYTGGMSCCPPMANPHQVNTPCRMLSTTSCKDDRDCSIRNGWQYSKCCPNADNGNGACIDRTGKC